MEKDLSVVLSSLAGIIDDAECNGSNLLLIRKGEGYDVIVINGVQDDALRNKIQECTDALNTNPSHFRQKYYWLFENDEK